REQCAGGRRRQRPGVGPGPGPFWGGRIAQHASPDESNRRRMPDWEYFHRRNADPVPLSGPHRGQTINAMNKTAAPRDRPITVSIVEDKAETREMLAAMLKSAPGLQCIGVHCSAESALKGIPDEKPDVVLVDIHLPGIN